MNLKFFILVVSMTCCASAATIPDSEVVEKKDAAVHESAPVPPDVTVPVDVTKAASPVPPSTVGVVHEQDKGKSLVSAPAAAITLYRHDKGAGVYRTESGDLVRMYRVEKSVGKPARRALPLKPRPIEGEAVAKRQRLLGNWFNNLYSGYEYDPYGSSYSYDYNYNYGVGGNPYNNYGAFYNNPYSGYGGGYPYGGMYGFGF